MSLFTLGGMDLGLCSALRYRMTGFSLAGLKTQGCIKCNSRKVDKWIWLDDASVDVNFICKSCTSKHQEGGIIINREVVMQVLQALNGVGMEKESNSLIQDLIKMVRRSVRIGGTEKDSLIQEIKSELVGWSNSQAQNAEERTQYRLGTLLRQFVQDLWSSLPAKLYSVMKKSPFKLQVFFVPVLKRAIKEQKTFKLNVLKRMIFSLSSAIQSEDIWKWMRRGIEGIRKFRYCFGTSHDNQQKVMYSICRSFAQLRYIYEENNQGIQRPVRGEIVVGSVPFLDEPFNFRLINFRKQEKVDIGVFFWKKSTNRQRRSHSPILFKFQPKQSSKKKDQQKCLSLPSKHSRIRLGQSIRTKSPRTQRINKAKAFQARNKDVISLYFDYTKQTFELWNKTNNYQYISMPMKNLSKPFYVYPCLRLVGVKVLVKFMNNLT